MSVNVTSSASSEELKNKLFGVIKKASRGSKEITEDMHFINDLGFDSLDLAELVMALETECGVEIPDEALEKIATVGDAIREIETRLGGAKK